MKIVPEPFECWRPPGWRDVIEKTSKINRQLWDEWKKSNNRLTDSSDAGIGSVIRSALPGQRKATNDNTKH